MNGHDAAEDDLCADVGYANLVTWRGPEVALVSLAVARARTRPEAAPRHVLEELRVAALSDRVRRILAGRRR